jgi:hypothetical protein
MRRPCPSDWRTLRVNGFRRRRRPLVRVPKFTHPSTYNDPSYLRPFGEISVGNHTQWSAFKPWLRRPSPHTPHPQGSRQPLISNWSLAMNTGKFESHHEAREALVLAIAGVTAIMLTAYLILLIL